MALFNNKTKWIIYLFVAAFIAALAWHQSRAAEPGLTVSAGTTIIRGMAPVIDLDWRWKAPQSEDANWETGITMYGSTTYYGKEQPNNFFPYVRYVDGFGKMDIGLGLCYLQNTDVYNGSKMNFSLMLGYRIKHWSIKYQHTSNAGSKAPNLGRDFLLLGREM
jgi:hypothetical protein